MVSSDLNW